MISIFFLKYNLYLRWYQFFLKDLLISIGINIFISHEIFSKKLYIPNDQHFFLDTQYISDYIYFF